MPEAARRWAVILLGGLSLLWLSVEDATALPAAVLGTAASSLLTLGAHPSQRSWLALLLAGAIAGAGSAIMAALLMFFKTAWHAHIVPDFPLPMILAMLERAPLWAVAGVLVGAAWGLWRGIPPVPQAGQAA